MKFATFLSAFLLLVTMTACQANDSNQPDPAQASSLHTENKPIKDGAPYADARQVLLYAGWKPTPDKQCQTQVVGANYAELCKKNSKLCSACNDMPELSSCSGDGACLMHFHKGSQSLSVTTYGPTDDWNVHGSDSQLNVSGSEIENAKQ